MLSAFVSSAVCEHVPERRDIKHEDNYDDESFQLFSISCLLNSDLIIFMLNE